MRQRLTLITFISADTDWQPMYALRSVETRVQGFGTSTLLILGQNNKPMTPFLFPDVKTAVEWVRRHCQAGTSVEFEASMTWR